MKSGASSVTLRLLERHKIRLTKELYSRIPALSKNPPANLKAQAIPGRFGGIQIIFNEPRLDNLKSQVEELIRNGKVTEDEAGRQWTLLARYLSNVWDITFSFYEGRYTVVLPNVARDLGLVPKDEGEDVLVFLCGEIFEIWHPKAWVERTIKTASAIAELIDELPNRESLPDY